MGAMVPLHIVTDSTADIPPHFAAELNITVLPCLIAFGHETYRDGIDMTNTEFYARIATSSVLPTTSHPSLGLFLETYERLCSDGGAVLSIHVSARLSSTIHTALMAAASLPELPIRVMDSQQLSMGLGWQAIMAARAAQRGLGLDEVCHEVERLTDRVRAVAALPSLWYVQRGGRIGKATALLGTALSMKPLVQVLHGEVLPVANVRTWHKALKRLAESIIAAGPSVELAVLNAANPRDGEALADLLKDYFPRKRMLMGEAGATITTHLGPGAVGVCCVLAEQ